MSLENPYSVHFNTSRKLSWKNRLAVYRGIELFSGSLTEWYEKRPKEFIAIAKARRFRVASTVWKHFLRKCNEEEYLEEPWKGSKSAIKKKAT